MATEVCVVCGKDTGVSIDTHIDFRYGYEEGLGQLCADCYGKTANNPDGYISINSKLIKDIPNDSELGALVRMLWWQSKV